MTQPINGAIREVATASPTPPNSNREAGSPTPATVEPTSFVLDPAPNYTPPSPVNLPSPGLAARLRTVPQEEKKNG